MLKSIIDTIPFTVSDLNLLLSGLSLLLLLAQHLSKFRQPCQTLKQCFLRSLLNQHLQQQLDFHIKWKCPQAVLQDSQATAIPSRELEHSQKPPGFLRQPVDQGCPGSRVCRDWAALGPAGLKAQLVGEGGMVQIYTSTVLVLS